MIKRFLAELGRVEWENIYLVFMTREPRCV